MFSYRSFGLTIQSEIELPELMRIADDIPSSDVTIHVGHVPIDENPQWFSGNTSSFTIKIKDVAHYQILNGSRIIIDPIIPQDVDKIRIFLLGSAFGALLFQRKLLPIHGSALDIGQEAVVFSGPSGIGKSTLAHAFVQGGYRLLSDDVVATEALGNQIVVHPAYPQQKLWNDSLALYDIDPKGLNRIWDGEEKYRLKVEKSFSPRALPLTTLVQLRVQEGIDEPILKPVRGAKKLTVLLDETYRSFFAVEMGIQQLHFQMASQIAHHIQVYEMVRPSSGYPPHLMVGQIVSMVTSKQERKIQL